jgi:hypothetical protein
MKKFIGVMLFVLGLMFGVNANAQSVGNLSLQNQGEGMGSTSSYFTARFWVTETDADGGTHNIQILISTVPNNYFAQTIDGPVITDYAITQFTWTRTTTQTGTVSFHLHNTEATITDLQVDSLTYVTTKPCPRCNPQTAFRSMAGSYDYSVDVDN